MPYRLHIMVCAGTGCVSNHSYDIMKAFEEEIERQGLKEEVLVVPTGCNGFCGAGPIAVIQPDDIFYQKLKKSDIAFIVTEHFLKGRPVKKHFYTPPAEKSPVPKMGDINFFKKQLLVTMRNRGMIDPEKIGDYIARDGYTALVKALTKMKPDEVIEEMKRSGLRGRGGGGFPTGIKWETCKKAAVKRNEDAYIICNADEGDPGAFMDRSIIEGDPHSVLEGMLIGAYAIGSKKGYVYVRMEYPLAIERFHIAIKQAREYGLLGDNILGTDLSFDVEVRRGAGAFVCGESTALMASIEGKVGEPRAKYIHTVEYGLWNKPSCLNNVETWATVPVIINKGHKWFTSIGTGDVTKSPWGGSKGTKVFSLAGKINNTGLVEVPMGITMREIIFDIGGGIPGKRKFKAVQTGGPSGGFIPESLLDIPVDYDRLAEAGSMMGSGGMVIMDETDCMVDCAKYFLEFLKDESCGKCAPCREGIRGLLEILTRITEGKGRDGDLELLEDLGSFIIDSALCALGGSAPNPVMSTLRHFKDEYIAHIRDKKCLSGVCKALVTYNIDQTRCNGCHVCVSACPNNCISGAPKQAHNLDAVNCIKCTACFEVCQQNAILRT